MGTKTFIVLAGNDGSKVVLRASAINMVQAPSRLSNTPNGIVLIGNQLMQYPQEACETIVKMLDDLDNERNQNVTDLLGGGVSKN